MITSFVCLPLFLFFFREFFFQFRTDEKEKKYVLNKNRVLPEISAIILWPQFSVYGR